MSQPADDHLDLDRLADLEEELLADDDAAAARRHLSGCPACQARRGLIGEVRTTLAALPDEPVPADVAQRLDAALTAVREGRDAPAATTVVPITARRRGWRAHPTAVGLGAAAAVAAVVAGLVLANGSGHSTAPSTSLAQGGGGASAPELSDLATTATGTDYTPGNLATDVPPLIGPAPAAAPKMATAPQTGAGARSAAPVTPVPAALARLYRSGRALADCVAGVEAGGSGVTRPLAIDFARYRGAPAVLIVLPGLTPGNLDAWFVGPRCSSADADLLHYEAVPAPTPSPSG